MTERERSALKVLLVTVILLLTATSLLFAQTPPEEVTKTFRPAGRQALKVDVRMEGGELKLSAVPRGDEGRARYRYDPERFSGELRWDAEANAFTAITDMRMRAGKDNDVDRDSELEILVPRAAPLELDLDVTWGTIELQGKDLRFDALSIDMTGGELKADFPARSASDLRRITLDLNMGEMDVSGLGNLSWETLDVNGSIGSLTLDLTGELRMERRATIDLEIGEIVVYVPKGIAVEARISKWGFLANVEYPDDWRRDGRYVYAPGAERRRADLYLDIRGGIGDISIRQR
jgi:hypothetical protein